MALNLDIRHIRSYEINRLKTKHYIACNHFTVGLEIESLGRRRYNDRVPGIARKRLPGKSKSELPIALVHCVKIRGRWRGGYFASHHIKTYILIFKQPIKIDFRYHIMQCVDYMNTIAQSMTTDLETMIKELDENGKIKEFIQRDKKYIDSQLRKYKSRRNVRMSIKEHKKMMKLKSMDQRRRRKDIERMNKEEAQQNHDNDE